MRTPRFTRALVIGALLIAAPAVLQAQAPASGDTVVLRGARVIDGTGGNPLDNAAIIVRDQRIIAIGRAGSVTTPADASVIDYSGKTIIPGLISAHSHVGIFAGLKAA